MNRHVSFEALAFTEKGLQLLRARGFVTEVQVLAIDARVVISGAAAVSSAPRRVRVPFRGVALL